jgi:hypothetical protein
LLREAGRHNDAYIVLDRALTAQPDDPELLYEAALTAERIGKPEILEIHLKHLLASSRTTPTRSMPWATRWPNATCACRKRMT